MSKILITGNGFDLFHHLPTKYGHFMSIMNKLEKLKINDSIQFDDLFDNDFGLNHSIDFKLITENYDYQNVVFDGKKIKDLKELLIDNLWYNHFKTVLEIDTWIDFETEIEFVLNVIVDFFKYANKVGLSSDYCDYIDRKVLIFFGVLKRSGGGTCYINELSISRERLNIKNVLEDLAVSLEGFIVIFNKYLTYVVGGFYKQRLHKYAIPFNLIDEIYTFNYTSSIEKFYNIKDSKIVYLHGKSNDDNNIQNLVLGISEINEEIKKSKMYDFAKYYQKINKKANHKFIKIPDDKSLKLNETIFYIIGHSLDQSDKEYIADLFKLLTFDLKKRAKICVFYYNVSDMENKLKNLLNIIDKEVVVNMNKENRLYFVELNEQNIKTEFEKVTYKHQPIRISSF